MHGRARPPKGFQLSNEQQEKLKKRTHVLKSATTEVLTQVQDRKYSEQKMAISGKLLMLNPEIYTAWNYRKDALSELLSEEGLSEDRKRALCEEELHLVKKALGSNAKSYGAWHHRRWIINLNHSNLQSEFRFIEEKLNEDRRNFHAWGYRKFLVQKSGRMLQEELQFTQSKIEQSFSNYSAWHYRGRCLEELYRPFASIKFEDLLAGKTAIPSKPDSADSVINIPTLELELETVHAAFVTDPDDSSAWFYYRWLIAQLLRQMDEEPEVEDVLDREQQFFESELLELDPNSKWILLTYAMLLQTKAEETERTPEVVEIYSKLMELDPMRKGFYEDVRDGKASILMEII